MKISFLLIFLSYSQFSINAQSIPRDVNTILISDISFNEVCEALLDANYFIEKKDNELKTVRTEAKNYPKYWNAKYTINIRVKDSIAYISGTFTAAEGQLYKDEPIFNMTNKKGETLEKSLIGYPFLLLNEFALGLKKVISYSKL